MKKLVLMLLMLPVAGAPLAAQEQVDRRFAIAPDASIRVQNLVGSVRVTGWDRDSIAVSGFVAKGGGRFYAGGAGRGAKLGIEEPADGTKIPASHLEIMVPRRSRVWVKTASADIRATDVVGGLDLYSVTGAVRVGGEAGQVYAESMDGNVDITASSRWVRAKTATGSVTVHVTGADVTATTVSGNIVAIGGRFERGRFETVTGDIRFEGDFDRGGAFTFESHAGAVEIAVPATVAANFDVSTLNGQITNELGRAQVRLSRDGTGKALSLETGPGGADVTVRSFKGDVVLRRQTVAK
jgi:surface antigen